MAFNHYHYVSKTRDEIVTELLVRSDCRQVVGTALL
jgi:hypothetical protein